MIHITTDGSNAGPESSISDEHKAWILALHQCAMQHKHRAAIVISGLQNYCFQLASDLIDATGLETAIVISDNIPGALKPKRALTQLGRECDAIVFDMFSGFDPDAFGAISGTLSGGGIFFVLIPDNQQWPELESSRFLQRAMHIIKQDNSLYWLEQAKKLPENTCQTIVRSPASAVAEPFRTVEQRQVVEIIEAGVAAKIPSVIVLKSDRGRGKSSALGLAAGRLLSQGIDRIIVTAPRMSISEPVFHHAKQIITDAERHHGRLGYHGKELIFIAPDALLDSEIKADLLLVDEAAAIPLPMLEALLNKYVSVVFATTVHGYEGTGRGFELKFDQVLHRLAPNWRLFTMNTPVRWSAGDPVEAWVDHMLCLDAELPDVKKMHAIEHSQYRMVLQDRDALINDDSRLNAIFAILINAHYRTRPSDLMYMLDSPSVRIYTLEYQHCIVAAVLINEEGEFDSELARLVYQGKRRPQGHLLAQTLALHAGCESASRLRYSRIMRIAVHPELQRQGLGSRLLSAVIQAEKKLQIDAIGSSFGATVDLVRFWESAGFTMVRLGFTRDHASGTHSAVMLLPVTENAGNVFRNVRSRFQRYMPVWLDEVYENLSEDMYSYLDRQKLPDDKHITDDDWQDIDSFAHSHRGYESCMWSLKKLVNQYPDVISTMSEAERLVIERRVSRSMGWASIAKMSSASGKADVIRTLRQAICSLLIKLKS